ncbi:schlafen family member 13-like [Brachyhypopomus gauderio]|uniref:schlafen family member 13-like n=1 Tax=Brachyhypopomus gauderio TaxID=698409 RepID=UPI0040424888
MASVIRVETAREYPDQVLWIEEMTFGEDTRKRLDKTVRERQKKVFLEGVCALLNSGGGILCVISRMPTYNYNEVGIGKDLEDGLSALLDSARIEEFLQVKQHENTLQFYVRSWFPAEGRARLCSLSTGLVERSGRSAFVMSPRTVVEFLKNREQGHDVYQEPRVKKQKLMLGSDDDIYYKAGVFYNEEVARLNQILDFGENVYVEFKSFRSEKNLTKRLEEALPRYLSAFGNTHGGFIFIGIDDKTREVVGCGQTLDLNELKRRVEDLRDKAMNRAVHTHHCARQTTWCPEVKVFPVSATVNDPGYIVAIKIVQFCCAVFEDDPKSWEIKNGTVSPLKCTDWLEKVQFPVSDDQLSKKFESALNLQDSPPQCQPVYSVEKIADLQDRIFPVPNKDKALKLSTCKELLEGYPNVRTTLSKFQSESGILIMSKSWAVDISQPGNEDVICEALLVTSGQYPKLFSVVNKETPELWKYAKETAFHLKQKLVNLGGYTKRVCVVPYLLDCNTGELINETAESLPYPRTYFLGHVEEVKALLRSLVIVVLSFISPLRDRLGSEILNLLTEEQYSILQYSDGHKYLFIHGLPGSGKTLVALEKIKKIKKSKPSEKVLYLCENLGLKVSIGKQNLCLCDTRSGFMKKDYAYTDVFHIVVDEGQNFRLEDGDWYVKAKEHVERSGGILWVFVDYFQKCHSFRNGLPSLPNQNNIGIAYLNKVVRNSKKVFNEMRKILTKIEDESSEDMSTHLKYMCEKMSYIPSLEGNFHRYTYQPPAMTQVEKLVQTLLSSGHSPRDITVLFSTRDAQDSLVGNRNFSFPHGNIEHIDDDVVVMDTIRRFSGLERNIVILVQPAAHPTQTEIEPNLLLIAYSRARIRLYLQVPVRYWTRSPIKQCQKRSWQQ